jgi:hypothetical protein
MLDWFLVFIVSVYHCLVSVSSNASNTELWAWMCTRSFVVILMCSGVFPFSQLLRPSELCGSGLCPLSGILETKKHKFRKLDRFPSLGEGRKTPTRLGPLERANLSLWTMDKVRNPSNSECYTPSSESFRGCFRILYKHIPSFDW